MVAAGGGRSARSPAHAVTSAVSPACRSATNRPANHRSSDAPRPAGGFLPRPHAPVPRAAGCEGRSAHPVEVLEGEAVRDRGDLRITVPEALTVDVAPGREGLQLQPHRARCPHRRGARSPMAGRPWAMATSRSSTTSPRSQRQHGTPSRSANESRNRWPSGEMAPSAHSCTPSAMRRSPITTTGSSAARAMRRPIGGSVGDDEEPVVAPGAQAGDRAHGVAAEPVGDEPLPRRGLVERTAQLPPEDEAGRGRERWRPRGHRPQSRPRARDDAPADRRRPVRSPARWRPTRSR